MSQTQDGAPVVLVADDDKVITHALSEGLRQKGYEVLNAFSGKETLEVALDKHPRLVLLDYSLPDIDGLEVLKRLRKDEWGATVPVIIASNIFDVDIMNSIMGMGVQDYVLKSDVNIDELSALIGKYVPVSDSDEETA